jgi:hypothetical protein
MANTFIKPTRIASAALGLLEREIVLPGLVWRDAGGDFAGAGGDTISIRVPARTQARTRALRGSRPSASEGDGIISMDALTETKVDVTLDTAVYSAVPVTDEELTLDITDFGAQILEPQVRAVAEGIENAVAAEMTGTTYATNLTFDSTDPYKTLIDAYVALNKSNIPRTDRVVVCGPDVEALILKSDHLSRVDGSGSDAALRRAEMGRIANFPIYVTNALPSNWAVAFHKTAFVLGMRAPAIPTGASFGSSQSSFGLAMRWLRDYDFRNVQDRSLVDTYIGTSSVSDGANEAQTVTEGGSGLTSFTLTYAGQTTASIAAAATALTVQQRLEALSNIEQGGVTVTGSAGGPYTVVFNNQTDVAQMTSTPTGGTGTVTVATATAGGSAAMVRAVKLTI